MNRLGFIILALILYMSSVASFAAEKRAFAIVTDEKTYASCKTSVDQYAESIKNEGMNVFVINNGWSTPEDIRKKLVELYKSSNLEGAVFIGDVPVPMIRDAQHLTTAFKMDQRRDWQESSVPSDRFYDDFDLKFNFIKRDSTKALYYYYSLASDGPQSINCDIYTARIKPPVVKGKGKYELISEFLIKAAKNKSSKHPINRLSYFAGHGYNSDCMVARIDEKLALSEQFSFINKGSKRVNYLDHKFEDNIKYRLLAELQSEGLDLAILHHHGSEDLQLMNGSPLTSDTQRWLEMAKKFFRGKIRGAKDTTAAKKYYIDNYKVPESWVANAFDKKMMLKDSLEDAAIDIHISDLEGFKPQAKVVIFDACFNGSFHLDDYISGHYIFADGETMVVKANSVNTLQDTWTNQLIGLLDRGVSVGNWAKGQMTLESHLIGDPTYRFLAQPAINFDLNEKVADHNPNSKYWQKLLQSSDPELRSLAIKRLASQAALSDDELLKIQSQDPNCIVRLMAFTQMRERANENLDKAIKIGLNDEYELIRRLSAYIAGMNYSPIYLQDLYNMRVAPGVSERVDFQIKSASEGYKKEEALAAFDNAIKGKSGKWYDDLKAKRKNIDYTLSKNESDMNSLLDEKVPAKEKRFTLMSLRNSNNIAYLDILFKFMQESKDKALRLQLAEAFGWYKYSYKKAEIIKFCTSLASEERDVEIKNELLRTINRLNN